MYYLYASIVMLLSTAVVWVFYRYSKLLDLQRLANESWPRIDDLLIERNELLGRFQELWVRMMAQPERVTAFQKILARESAHHWEDLGARAKMRDEIETIGQALYQEVAVYPQANADPEFIELRTLIQENTEELHGDLLRFNTAVRGYNRLLQKFPINHASQAFGSDPIPTFVVRLAQL